MMRRRAFIATAGALAAVAARPAAAALSDAPYALTTPSGTIAGTLLLPTSAAATTVALIVPGSGPIDRNGNGGGLALNTYQKLAKALAEHGIAAVRYDKRGIAASAAAAPSEAALRVTTFADDVAAWIAKLRADGRFSRVVLIGHSEGSLLAMLAAQHAPVDAFASLEGAGYPLGVVLREQLGPRLQPYPDLATAAATIMNALAAGKTVSDVPGPLMSLFRPSVQPYLISLFAYDPCVEIAKLTGRVTIVQGTHDVQVPVADARALAAARPSAAFVLIDGMTHVLTDDPGTTIAQQATGAYADPGRPLDAKLVATLITI